MPPTNGPHGEDEPIVPRHYQEYVGHQTQPPIVRKVAIGPPGPTYKGRPFSSLFTHKWHLVYVLVDILTLAYSRPSLPSPLPISGHLFPVPCQSQAISSQFLANPYPIELQAIFSQSFANLRPSLPSLLPIPIPFSSRPSLPSPLPISGHLFPVPCQSQAISSQSLANLRPSLPSAFPIPSPLSSRPSLASSFPISRHLFPVHCQS